MTRSRRRTGAVAVALLTLALVASSCGSRDDTANTTTTPPATTSKSHAPTSTDTVGSPSAKSTSPQPTTADFVAGSACQRGQVEVSQADPVPADQHTLAPFVVTNTSAAPCTLTGYVTVRVVDQIGRAIGKGETHEPGPDATITLHPNGSDRASFELHTKADTTGTNCRGSSFITVALPGADLGPPAYAGSLGVSVCDGYLGVTPIIATPSGHG